MTYALYIYIYIYIYIYYVLPQCDDYCRKHSIIIFNVSKSVCKF